MRPDQLTEDPSLRTGLARFSREVGGITLRCIFFNAEYISICFILRIQRFIASFIAISFRVHWTHSCSTQISWGTGTATAPSS